jgi:superfamily II DNA or RNA helicase
VSQILIENNFCYITDESDITFVRELDDELSFKVQGAEHMRAFKGYWTNGHYVKWDGVHRILTANLSFPRGLLQRVLDFYASHGKKVKVFGDDKIISPLGSFDILPKLREIGKDPYFYQIETLEAVKKQNNGIIRIATGGGKTVCIALMLAHFGKSSIVYVVGTDLLYQMHELFKTLFGKDNVGIIGDGLCDIRDINVASVWTVGKALGLKGSEILEDTVGDEKDLDENKYRYILDIMGRAKVHIFDECHLAACDTIQAISRNINPEHIYGLSATPHRDDNASLLIEAVFGNKIVDISASYLIQRGFLAKPIIKFLRTQKYSGNKKDKYPTVYKNHIISNPDRNGKIITGASKLVEQGYQVLVSYQRIGHGKFLYDQISKDMPCILLSGKDSSEVRMAAKEKLENKEINCILASSIFDLGVDLPSLSGLILAGGGKSSVRALQRIGRVIRKFEGKSQAAVIDFIDDAPFLKQHSTTRRNIYSIEEEFQIILPK